MFFNTSNSDNSTKLGNLDVEYVDGEEIKVENLLPINSDEVEEKANVFNFSVENKGNSYAYYDIKLVDIDLPLALKDENFKWRLMRDNEIVNEGNFHELANTKDYLKRSIEIPIKEIQEYKLMMWIENSNDIDQSYILNRNGSFKIQIEARQLDKSPKDEITVISNTTNGNLEDLKIYGNTIDGKNVGDNKTINITVSQNLVDNGLGELGDNTNFSQLTYNKEKYKSLGSFYVLTNKSNNYSNNKYISIIGDNSYYFNVCTKQNETGTQNNIGIASFDIDKKSMIQFDIAYKNTTRLAHDLNDGDRIVYLEDISKYNVNESTPIYDRGLIFWNYTDSRGYTYPPETYSKNNWWSTEMYTYEGINKVHNTITLIYPWNHGTYKKGTIVSQTASIGSQIPWLTVNKIYSKDYSCYEQVKEGYDSQWGNSHFGYGTKYIKYSYWTNVNNIEGTETYYSRIIIRKNDNIQNIAIDMTGHDPLRSIYDTRDYIDYKNKRIVRLINSDGTIKSNPEYEPITLPEIKTYDGNTIIESSDDISPIFQSNY